MKILQVSSSVSYHKIDCLDPSISTYNYYIELITHTGVSEIDGWVELETILYTLTGWCCSCNGVVQWYIYIILSLRQFYRDILSVISMWNRYDVPTCQFWASEINPVLNILSYRLKIFRNHQYTGDRRE